VALCVSTDEDVLALVTDGLLDGLRPGAVVVNHGTGTPGNAVRLAGICAAAGVESLDAPVSGGRMGAVRLAEVFRQGSAASTALALLPLNSAVDPNAPDLLAPRQYLILDMELFDTAMTEAGIDVGCVTRHA
jgi:6-phosphogluconate dehydrogenase (decarboxylating)